MRTVRHNAYIQSRKRRARYIAFAGFAILTSSLWIALNPKMILPAYAAMFLGFVLFNMGMQQVGKWSRNPRNDQLLDAQMSKLGDRYTLIHYPTIGKHKAEHVLVYPGGMLVLTAREIDGTIENVGGRWRKKGGGFRRLFGFSGPQLGNPNMDTEEALAEVENYLKENQIEVDVEGIIVFLHPMVELEIENPDYPVLHGEEVPGFVISLPADPSFTTAERERLVSLLSAGEEVQQETPQTRRRPVKRRAA
ncbi:MAG TPA: NERD domain-containing protein [Thermomicrobiales bacterium]|nr:NERD domain-containing protein [Thermomicrobiales bacterium]